MDLETLLPWQGFLLKNNNNMEEENKELHEEAKQYVRTTGRWYKFFGILGIVGCALMVLCSFMMLLSGAVIGSVIEEASMYGEMSVPALPMWLMAIIYLISAGLMIPVIIYMFRGAKASQTAVEHDSSEEMVKFLAATKSYWKYCGILTIVMVALCIIVVPIAIVAAVAAAL